MPLETHLRLDTAKRAKQSEKSIKSLKRKKSNWLESSSLSLIAKDQVDLDALIDAIYR